MSIRTWQDVLLEVVETDPADFTDRKNICISPKDLGDILRAALQERDAEIERMAQAAAIMHRWKTEDDELIAAQRKVLEQALETLNTVISVTGSAYTPQQKRGMVDAAIAAIQEVLS